MSTYRNRIAGRLISATAALAFLAAPSGEDSPRAQASPSASAEKHASYSVAVSDDYAVVGAPWHNDFNGAAYVLRRDGERWVTLQTLSPADLGQFDHFGASVSIDGDRLVVGAAWQNLLRGAAYVFRRVGKTWIAQEKLVASNAMPEREFGTAVAVTGDVVTVTDKPNASTQSAATYRFERAAKRWLERQVTESPAREPNAPASDPRTGSRARAAIDLVDQQSTAPLVFSVTSADTVRWVLATDGAFEDRVEISWGSLEFDTVVYKVLRNSTLLSIVSSDDSLYIDSTGLRDSTYSYCVVVRDMTGAEGSPTCNDGSSTIFPPTKVSASDGQFIDRVEITWRDQSAVEVGYYLKRGGTTIDTLATNASSATDTTNITTPADYKVVAFDDQGRESSGIDDEDSGFVGVVLPPDSVSASDGEYADFVKITWVDQGNEDFFIVSRVNLATLDSTVIKVTDANATSHIDATAQQDTTYRYCVVASESGLQSIAVCDEGSIDLPGPANVQASDGEFDDRVQITWDDVSDSEDAFVVLRDGDSLATTAANRTSYNDRTAVPGTVHTYCVLATTDEGGVSADSCDSGVRSVVVAPTNVVATDGTFEDRVDITWQTTSTTAALFQIFRVGPGGTLLIKSVTASGRSHSDVGGTAGVEYDYEVQAVTALDDSSTRVSDLGHRELRAPSAVAASDDAFEDRVEITWSDDSQVENGYYIYRRSESDTTTTVIDSVGANMASFADRQGVSDTTYVYGVAAFDTEGESTGVSDLTEDEGLRILLAPGSVSATDDESEIQVEITWSDRSNAEDGYYIYRNSALIDSTMDNVTSVIDSMPMLGATSEYSVRAFDAQGTSAAGSDSGSTMILAPASFNASDIYEDRIELRWVDVSEIERGYILHTDLNNVTLSTDTLVAGSTSFTDSNAQPGISYDYRLQAYIGTATSKEATDTGIVFVPQEIVAAATLDVKLPPSPISANDLFGTSMAISGDVLIVGSPKDTENVQKGSAYVFRRNADLTWTQEAKFSENDNTGPDEFGTSVSISGDRALVGVPLADVCCDVNGKGRSGTAYLFDGPGGWSSGDVAGIEVLPQTEAAFPNELFGAAVAISGDAAVVGAPGRDSSTGSVNLYSGPSFARAGEFGTGFGEGAAGDSLGASVAISGDWAIAGVPGDDDLGTDSGSAVLYRRIGQSEWEQNAKITASDGAAGAAFGASVAISGNWAIVGAPGVSDLGDDTGAAYAFELNPNDDNWTERAKLTANDGAAFGRFGSSAAMNDGRAIVGSVGDDQQGVIGSAYIFERDSENTWTTVGKVVAGDGTQGDMFGASVAIGDEWAVVGSPNDDVEGAVDAGSAHTLFLVAAPDQVAASDGTFDSRIHIAWRDRSLTEEGFILYRDGVEYARLGEDAEFYDDFDVQPDRTYEYQVSAVNKFSGFESRRVPDFGRRPPNGHITGSISSQAGAGVEGVSVCLEPSPTRALLLDGFGGHVRIPDDSTFNFRANEDFTIEVWFSYAGTDRSPRLISKLGRAGMQERPFDLGLQRTGRLFFLISDGTNVARVLSARNDLNDDTWHHVACVHDATAQTLYLHVDGVVEDSTSTAGLVDEITNDSDVFIGGFETDTWFGGQIDELRVWDKARTPAEINATRDRPLAGTETGLLGYWPFDAFSGRIVTDFAGEGQYGVFVGGVYRTDDVAPLDVCATTDADGSFVLRRVRYDENGTDFKLRPSLGIRQFSPAIQPVTLNDEHPVENQVIFADISSYTLSGQVGFADSDCFEPDVEIQVDGDPAGLTDKNGKFSVTVDNGQHTIRATLDDFTFVVPGSAPSADSLIIDVQDDSTNIDFTNTTKHMLSGRVGGGCDPPRFVGDVAIRIRSENNCLDTTFVDSLSYSVTLPPQKYFASATVNEASIPASLSRIDVVRFFENLGEREIDLSAVADTTLDFVYRAPLTVTIESFDAFADSTCSLTLEDGTPLPAGLPVVPQFTFVDLVIRVHEVYGPNPEDRCLVDAGQVVVFDEISDQQDSPDTLMIVGGEIAYRTVATTPNLARGRTEGGIDRSFQKALRATALVDGRLPVTRTEWVLVTGHVAPEGAEFLTMPTMEFPLFILRDPPGDGSYAHLEEGMGMCATLTWDRHAFRVGQGAGLDLKLGGSIRTWVGVGGGADTKLLLHAELNNRFLAGTTEEHEQTLKLCLTTKRKFSTSLEEDFLGEEGDVYVGAGITFLFSDVGVIAVNDCTVEQSTAPSFEPDSIHTTFAFTEQHVTGVLIPELEAKAAFYLAAADSDSVVVFETMRDQWQSYVDENKRLKRVASFTENRSFSGGADFEYTFTTDSTTTSTRTTVGFVDFSGDNGLRLGVKDKSEVRAYYQFETHFETLGPGFVDSTVTREWTVGYVLSDDDAGDSFTVDIKDDHTYLSPIFDVLGGRSSCPYEPWPDPETGVASMIQRDDPALTIDGNSRQGVPPDQPALFGLTIENDSDEQRDYSVRALSQSNPGGAIIRLNGSPIANGLTFTIDGLAAHQATLSVERGPTRYAYDDLKLVVGPACRGDAFVEADDVFTIDELTYHVVFQTACSDIALFRPEPGWTFNKATNDTAGTVELDLTDYELEVSLEDALSVTTVGAEYRRLGSGAEGPSPWAEIPKITPGVENTRIMWQLASPPFDALDDGVYELRAFAECNGRIDLRGYSAVSTGTIDRSPPQVFGTPEPSDGQLSLGEDISITFNELIHCASVDSLRITLEYVDGPTPGDSIAVNTVCNGTQIIVEPLADPADLEGRTLRAHATGVVDLLGNPMEGTRTWEFIFQQSLFTWSQTHIVEDVALGDPGSISAVLVNGTEHTADFVLTSLPPFLSVTASNGAGRLEAGGTQIISFDIDRTLGGGAHHEQVVALGTNSSGTDTIAVVVLDVTLNLSCFKPQWTVNPSDYQYNMTMVAEVGLEDTGVMLTDPNDRLAAFVGGQLRGLASPNETASGDDLWFLTVYSNRAGNETVRFEVWDDDRCRKYGSTIERFAFVSDAVIGSPSHPARLTATDVLPDTVGVFALGQGWNWFSTNVKSADMRVVNVLASLAPGAGDILKSKTAFAVFDPDSSIGWVGTLDTFDNTSGYMIRLSDAGTILQEGARVDPAITPIPLQSGWNWIGYLPDVSNTVTDALVDLGGQGLLSGGEVIKSHSAFAQWDVGWNGNLGILEPGEGYRLFLQNESLPGAFTYPANPSLVSAVAGVPRPVQDKHKLATDGVPEWFVEPSRFQYNMTVIATVQTNGVVWRDSGDVLGAFVDGECRGLASPMYVAGLDRTLMFVMIHSNEVSGEAVSCRVFGAGEQGVYDVDETLAFEADAVAGSLREPLSLTTGRLPDAGLPKAYRLSQNHPNPFNPFTTIRFDLPQASRVVLKIYNVRGHRVRTLVNRDYEAGFHRVIWDGKSSIGGDAASGVYFYELRAGTFTDRKKMVLLR